ncbi:MAG TPA: alpha/beta hydrolase, partial [Vicinamibacterales bacterium]|nr:alpha/beta hydrolase [Vicinamibacterales bacterium]
KLHVRAYGSSATTALPVVCLPGLARTGADFHRLASALADDAKRPRYVLALDYRGRGRSDYDGNPDNYSLPVELADVLSVLTALEIGKAVFVGTSRGGLLAMLLGSARPAVLAGVVLNDIGPVIEPAGVARIRGYVGQLPQPKSFEEAAESLRQLFSPQFPALSAADWTELAQRMFRDQGGRIIPDYDPKLAHVLRDVDIERPLPPLWKEFDSLAPVPMLIIRGANSDLLSPATFEAMRARRTQCETLIVPDQGHAPLLTDDETISHIGAFVRSCEQSESGA